MKKVTTTILAGAMALCFVACNSMESDARKTAKNTYRAELQWNGKINMSVQEQKKIIAWGNQMLEKYGNERTETGQKFKNLVDKELKKIRTQNR
jgi:hypothetical protein